jgi:hypothetical protein
MGLAHHHLMPSGCFIFLKLVIAQYIVPLDPISCGLNEISPSIVLFYLQYVQIAMTCGVVAVFLRIYLLITQPWTVRTLALAHHPPASNL